MMKSLAFAVLFCAGVVLGGCATLSEEQCQVVDWHRLGQVDGFLGRSVSFIEKHAKACAKHGIATDAQAYRKGWRIGIAKHCTPQNGLESGLKGHSYHGVCPSDLEAAFLSTYRPAKRVADAEHEVEARQREIDRIVLELEDLALSTDPLDRDKARQLQWELRLAQSMLRTSMRDFSKAQRALSTRLKQNPALRAF